MALLEINLEKPALIEEIVDEEVADTGLTGRMAGSTERGRGGGGSALRKLAMVGAIVAVVAVTRKLRSGGSSRQSEPEGIEVPIEDGSSGSSNRGQQLRVLGMVLAVLGAVAAARRMQSGNRQ